MIDVEDVNLNFKLVKQISKLCDDEKNVVYLLTHMPKHSIKSTLLNI